MSIDSVDIIIPSSPADRDALFDSIKEIHNSMTRADSEKEYQKESIDALAEKYGIKSTYIRRMAVDYHKNQFDKKSNEHDQYANLYETIIKD